MSDAYPIAVAQGWHPVAEVGSLGTKPIARTIMDVPVVVYGGSKGPRVLRDRCPHRGMPLSLGRVAEDAIVCPYHGWRFGADGRCLSVPGARSVPDVRADALPCIVRAGLVWTALADRPPPFPRLPPALQDRTLDRFWWVIDPSPARLLDAIENHLDPAHPHHVHAGMVRSASARRPVTVSVHVDADGAEAVYEEHGAASGWLARLIEGNRTRSIGRYFPPTIGEILFEGPHGPRVSIAVVFVPEKAMRVRPYAHFATPRGQIPATIKRQILKALLRPVLNQDRRALARQLSRDGPYAMGPLDFLGPAIWAFANGRIPEPVRYDRTVEL